MSDEIIISPSTPNVIEVTPTTPTSPGDIVLGAGQGGAVGPAGPKGDTGATGATGGQGPSGVIGVTAPITNTGTSTAAQIGLDQTALAITPSQVTGTAVITTDARLSDQRTPLDNSVTSAKIVDGTIVNADINVAAAIDATKINGTAVTMADLLTTFFGYPATGYDCAPRQTAFSSRSMTNGVGYFTSFIPLKTVTNISEITMLCNAGGTDVGGTTTRRMGLFQVTSGVGTAAPVLTCLGVTATDDYLFRYSATGSTSTATGVAGTFNGTSTATYTCNTMTAQFTIGQWVKVTGGTGATHQGYVSASTTTSFTLVGVQTVTAGSSSGQTATTIEVYGKYTRPLWTPTATGNSTTLASITLNAGTTYAVGALCYNTGGTFAAPSLQAVGGTFTGTLLPMITGGSQAITNFTTSTIPISGNTSSAPWARLT